jgi:hypothetical protein
LWTTCFRGLISSKGFWKTTIDVLIHKYVCDSPLKDGKLRIIHFPEVVRLKNIYARIHTYQERHLCLVLYLEEQCHQNC